MLFFFYRLSRVGIGVKKDANTLKVVAVAKDGSHLCALLGQKNGEPVAVESIALAVDLELELNLERGGGDGLEEIQGVIKKAKGQPFFERQNSFVC